ncbi:MAG TPA: type IV secretion system DNA-binding domain-containing protein, partial [Patescibacteria group bacterium]|nr:type IV secretion system DNA-binding domain-containing protein [Patescibacteria group bacterium]
MNKINFFANTNFRHQERTFGIKREDRTRHMYVIGKTGMGKTNLLENMAIQDIRNGEGVCVVDPHGEFAEKMLRAVPKERINDVVYFNPADKEFPVAFNILEAVDEDKKNLVASGMMGVFKKIWPDVWSPRMEYILNNTILALLDYPGSTMLGVNRMMFDKDFRKKVYPKIKDPVVKSFWINEFDKWDDKFRKEAVAAIQNKVGQFLSSVVIRHIVGQPKSTIDMREIMDNQKILIVNLSKGRIGEDAMRLLGGMVVTKIQLAAMGRVDTTQEERKDFYLYVDEFQNFATESFANILSEARKYRLNLILAHQYINQLVFDQNSVVRDAVFGNVGTMVTFRVGADDAEFLEKEFEPVFMMNDLVNLAKYNVYLKLMIDGITGDAFSATTLPPADLSDTAENEEKAIKVSRERYGKNRAEVEDKIARWSGMMEAADYENMARKNAAQKVFEPVIGKPEYQETKIPRPEAKPNPTVNISPQQELRADTERDIKFVKNLPAQKHLPSDQDIKTDKKQKDDRADLDGEKKMYTAVCDTCEEKIVVPFKPDPTRPTFCKECLKEYQRARARAQNESA